MSVTKHIGNIDGNPYRLSTNLTPVHQDITLIMPKLENPGEDVYTGFTQLIFELQEPTKIITLNAKGIEFGSAFVQAGEDGNIYNEQPATKIEVDDEKEIVNFYFPEEIVGVNTLRITFHRKFNPPNKMHGLHQSTFNLPDGVERVMATTQFESTSAREAFPCCDDPLQKSTFQTTLIVPEDRVAISTTELISERFLGNGLKKVVFGKTPRMSTYLLAFIVGDFEYLERETGDGVNVRFYATPGKLDKGEFALDVTVKALEYFSDYFNFPYSKINSKCDILAIPDFEAGAMENIGAVTFREVLLFVDPKETSIRLKRLVASVICHEIAHQWKGNLVTPRWWNNLWLKESFATFMADKAIDALFPEWNIWDSFLAETVAGGKSLASLRSAHPIEVPVQNPQEIDQIYDAISYNMGGSVLRMLESWLGEDVFCEGIRLYVQRYAFSNTRTEDLWAALEEVSGQPVLSVMNSWTKQTGYPIVHIEDKKDGLLLRQERFFMDRDTANTEVDSTIWKIPISLKKIDGSCLDFVFSDREMLLKNISSEDVLMLNPAYTGIYRVHYTPQMLGNLSERIRNGELSVSDRLGIQEDFYTLMRARYVTLDDYLSFLDAYKKEENHHVWASITQGLNALVDILFDDPYILEFENWACTLLVPIKEKLGWGTGSSVNEDDDTKLLRQTVLGALVEFNDARVVDEARILFSESEVDLVNISPDLRGIVLNAVAKNGDDKVFNKIVSLHQLATKKESEFGPELSLKYLGSLSQFGSKDLVVKALRYSISKDVRSQDSMRVWMVPIISKKIAWEYLKENWELLDEKFGSTRMIGRFIGGAINGVPSEEFADEVEEFFKENPAPRATEAIKQSVEVMRTRARFKGYNKNALSKFFN